MSGRHRRDRQQRARPAAAAQLPPSASRIEISGLPGSHAREVAEGDSVEIVAAAAGMAPNAEADELLELLASFTRERRALDEHQQQLVEALLRAGVSWARLGAALGVSRQAAHKRYSPGSTGRTSHVNQS